MPTVPDSVKKADDGCKNCLWNYCECIKGSRYFPDTEKEKPFCKSYVYYD